MGSLLKRLILFSIIVGIGAGLAAGAGQEAIQLQGVSSLLWVALLAYGVQWSVAIPAIITKKETFFDLTGSITYLMCVGFAFWTSHTNHAMNPTKWVVGSLVVVWALRLGSFLTIRIHRTGKDDRFIKIKQDPFRFFNVWTLQGLWVFLTSMAVLVLLTSKSVSQEISLFSWIGWGLWLLGFGIEVVADSQKSAFNRAPENQGKWINVGLWRHSQHPNYFGEMLLWLGLFLSGIQHYSGWQWLAAFSPIFVFLLLSKVSGIPLLRKRGLEKWGDDPAYLEYRKHTNVLMPGPAHKA